MAFGAGAGCGGFFTERLRVLFRGYDFFKELFEMIENLFKGVLG